MDDTELLRMAAFKLHECAQRILVLADSVEAPRRRTQLLSLQRALMREERRLHGLVEVAAAGGDNQRTGDATITSVPTARSAKPAAA